MFSFYVVVKFRQFGGRRRVSHGQKTTRRPVSRATRDQVNLLLDIEGLNVGTHEKIGKRKGSCHQESLEESIYFSWNYLKSGPVSPQLFQRELPKIGTSEPASFNWDL